MREKREARREKREIEKREEREREREIFASCIRTGKIAVHKVKYPSKGLFISF